MSLPYPRFMLVRQRLGILLMILFLPINGPLLRIGFEEIMNQPVPIGEFYFFTFCVILFFLGGIMTFTPKLKSPFQE
tara:strand:- start:2006 stop:2236 length:231 start_codon:yes stop_codon:yes gene_type:complete